MNTIPETSSTELQTLAQSDVVAERVNAALNENAGQDILSQLMSDDAWQVREAVAKKGYGLETLVDDPVLNVSQAAETVKQEQFINDPDNVARYKELLKEYISANTFGDMEMHISPTSYDDDISANTVLEWYNSYCESSERPDISFERHIEREGYTIFSDTVYDEERELVNEIRKDFEKNAPELLPIFDNMNETAPYDLLEEGGYKGTFVDYENFLSNSYHVNLMFATDKERNTDMGAIPEMFYDSADKSADFEYSTDNALTYLIHQQGYTLADIYMGLKNPETVAENKFLKSIVSEIENYPDYSMAELTALIHLSGKNLIETLDAIANSRDYITLSKDTMIGIYNEWQGSGSILEVELEKDMVIPTSMIRNVQFESRSHDNVRGNNGYTVDDVYGLVGSCWDGEASITTEAPELKKENMKETQATLQKLNKQATKDISERDYD